MGVAGVLAAPLLFPICVAVREPDAAAGLTDFARQASLLGTTAELVALALILVMPAGLGLAAAWFGSDAPGRRCGRVALLALLAVPLPVLAVAWQGAAGLPWSAFRHGVVAAGWVHAAAALPWVALAAGAGLLRADRAVVDDVAVSAAAWQALATALRVCAAGVAVAALWVAAQTAGEIVVTDVAQVRTFAEEVYTQFVAPVPEAGNTADRALARAVIATLPQTVALTAALLLVGLRLPTPRWGQTPEPGVWWSLGRTGWVVSAVAGMATVVVLAFPVASLVRLAGVVPPGTWSPAAVGGALRQAIENDGAVIGLSMIAAGTAAVALTVAVAAASLTARASTIVRVATFGLAGLAVATPGPVVGVGVKQAVDCVVGWEEWLIGPGMLRAWLYDGPSMAPVMWAWSARAWPIGLAVLWPVVAGLPEDYSDGVRLESGSTWQAARHAAWPALAPAAGMAWGLMAVFSLGEVSASKLPATPGAAAFAHDLFSRMHFGLKPDLAAASMLLVIGCVLVATAAGGVALTARRHGLSPIRRQPKPARIAN